MYTNEIIYRMAVFEFCISNYYYHLTEANEKRDEEEEEGQAENRHSDDTKASQASSFKQNALTSTIHTVEMASNAKNKHYTPLTHTHTRTKFGSN